jgi:molybdopterin synthase catalytic subunit
VFPARTARAMPPIPALTDGPPDIAALMAAVASQDGERAGVAGAVVTFVGVVRGENLGRRVRHLEYEAYSPLVEKAFSRIGREAGVHWPDTRLAIQHRVGHVALGEPSVGIAAASPHRANAFAACRYAIERIKQIAPIWKREHFEGGDVWIEGATADPDDEGARAEAVKRACV